MPTVDDFAAEPLAADPPQRRRLAWLALAVLAALAIGGAAALWGATRLGWVAWRGWDAPRSDAAGAVPPAASSLPAAPPGLPAEQAQAALGVRIAELEQRIARLDLQSVAAEQNAARAEALMIAFAARRAVDRGLPLGFLETQLRLRFGDAQPNAVATIAAAGSRPVTRDRLLADLNSLAPRLAGPAADEGGWERLRREVTELFVVRRADQPSSMPERRLARARGLVESGQVEAAIAEVERLPARSLARTWLAQAHSYVTVHRALDLIETAALLGPRPADGSGSSPPSPAEPTPTPAPQPSVG